MQLLLLIVRKHGVPCVFGTSAYGGWLGYYRLNEFIGQTVLWWMAEK